MIKQNKNKGFSLLELLVAVAILAVVVTPFLMTFLTTTRLNASTKERQRAKYAATNVMEDIRSVDASAIIEEVEKARQSKLDNEGQTDENDSSESEEVAYTFESGGNTYRVYPNEDGTYLCTTIYTDTSESSNSKVYTIDAEINPNVEDEETDSTAYNQIDMAHIKAMSSVHDAFFEIGGTTDDARLDQLAEKDFGSRNETILKQIYNTVNREITITISYANTDEDEKKGTVVSVGNRYATPTYPQGVGTEAPQVIYSDDNTDVRSVYLFFNPLYNGTARQARETINVVNEKDAKCDVFLIKQDWPNDVTKYNLFTYSRYCPYTDNAVRNNNYLLNVRLSQNWDVNDYNNKGELTTIRTDVNKDNIRALYCGTAGGNNYSPSVGNIPAAEVMGLTDLAGKKKSNFIYNVTVNAYEGVLDGKEREGAKAICTLNATT